MKNLLLLVLFIILVSCESKSGKRQPTSTNIERFKVVIQNDGNYVSRENTYYYKIKILKDTTQNVKSVKVESDIRRLMELFPFVLQTFSPNIGWFPVCYQSFCTLLHIFENMQK